MIKQILFLVTCISAGIVNAQTVDSVVYIFDHRALHVKMILYDNGEFKYTKQYEIGGEIPIPTYGHWKLCDNRLILSREPSDKDFKVKEIGKSPKNRMFFYARTSYSPISNYRFHGITADKQDTIILNSDLSGRLMVNCRVKAFWITDLGHTSPTHRLSNNTNEVYITFNYEREFHDEEWIFEHEDTLRPRNEQGELLKYVLTRQKYEKVE